MHYNGDGPITFQSTLRRLLVDTMYLVLMKENSKPTKIHKDKVAQKFIARYRLENKTEIRL